MGNWIQISNGAEYDFDTGTITGTFTVESVAYPLSGLNRFGRHTTEDWTVALHSCCVANTIYRITNSKVAAFAGLMHDAHEAIFGDIVTPFARALGDQAFAEIEYAKMEAQEALEARLNIPPMYCLSSWTNLVRLADTAALICERDHFVVKSTREWNVVSPGAVWTDAMNYVMKNIVPTAAACSPRYDGGCALFMGMYTVLSDGGTFGK